MKVYWTLKSIPELRDLSLSDRLSRYANAVCASRQRLTWSRRLTETFVFGGLPTGLVFLLGSLAGHPVLGVLTGGGIGGLILSQREIARVRRELQAANQDGS